MGRCNKKSGPKEGIADSFDIFVLLGPSGQVEIVDEDSGALDTHGEGMPSAGRQQIIPLRGARPSRGDLKGGDNDLPSNGANTATGKLSAFTVSLAMTGLPGDRRA